ncbi:MAG: glutamine-hydrolyzing GMP synthase, partial [Limisphaerales bacterium]
MSEQIVILDFGSQYTQVIARRVRECNVFSTILPYNTKAAKVKALNPSGIILSGGPCSVFDKKAPLPDKKIFELDVPMIGICFGVQLLAQFLGGRVEKSDKREYGKGTLNVTDRKSALFAGLPGKIQVWNSHSDKLTKLPRQFKAIATTENSAFAAIEHRKRKIFGLQFHPEVTQTKEGNTVLENFTFKICKCTAQWKMENLIEHRIDEI